MSAEALLQEIRTLKRRVSLLETNESIPIIARYTTNTGSVPSASLTRINYATLDFDTWSAVTTGASWVFTAPIGGYYLVRASLLLDAGTAFSTGEQAQMAFYKEGVLYSYPYFNNHINAGGATLYVQVAGSDIVDLAQDETVDVRVYQTSGSSLNINSGATYNYVSIARIR